RMIRSIDDQWSKNSTTKKYDSPIANLIFNYITEIDKSDYEVIEYKPIKRESNIEGEEALVDRFNQLMKIFRSMSSNRNTVADEIEEVPSIDEIYASDTFQEGL